MFLSLKKFADVYVKQHLQLNHQKQRAEMSLLDRVSKARTATRREIVEMIAAMKSE